MKFKRGRILIYLLAFCAILFITYWFYYDSNFVKKNMELYSGVEEYIVKCEYFNDSESYIEVIIPKIEKQRLLKKFPFETEFESKLKGRITCQFITENTNYEYYLINKGFGPYGYILLALEINGNTLQVYEYYSN